MKIASYLEARRLPTIWYRVNSGDADAATFLHYLGVAASRFGASRQPPLPPLTPEYLSSFEGFVRRHFREVFDRLPQPAVLVFDSFQELAASAALRAAVLAGLEEAPEGINIVVASRAEPPCTMSSSRWRAAPVRQ